MRAEELIKFEFHYLVPDKHVESIVYMEILMMIIMENSVRLPGLPPLCFECDSRMVNDAMVVSVHENSVE